jgi:hypothetical protein
MCAQCAVVAVAAIGAVGIFRDQIRARIDLAVGIEPAGEQSNATPGMPPTLLLLLIIAALVDLHHEPAQAGSGAESIDAPAGAPTGCLALEPLQ